MTPATPPTAFFATAAPVYTTSEVAAVGLLLVTVLGMIVVEMLLWEDGVKEALEAADEALAAADEVAETTGLAEAYASAAAQMGSKTSGFAKDY